VIADRPLRIAVVGGGPTGTAVLERLVASADELLAGLPVEVHLVDPYPPGAGRVWRHEQSPLMWMNSMAEDVTMFTDETVRCEGPIVAGPTLDEWAAMVRDDELPSEDVVREVRALDGMTFPSRRLQSAYLAWVFDRICSSAPTNMSIVTHATEAVDVTDDAEGGQRVHLTGEDDLVVDAVLLTLGHLDVDPRPHHARDADFARVHGLVHVPPAYTADLDLAAVEPGAPTIVRGFGLAFVDAMIMLTEGRGGRFVEGTSGRPRYEATGAEPQLYVGSRRGVPYRSKIGYRLQAPRPHLPRFLDHAAITRILDDHERIDFRTHIWPLLLKEVLFASYHELFHAHPERTARPWTEVEQGLAELSPDGSEWSALVARAVPAVEDRFDVGALDRPLAGLRFADGDELQGHVVRHIEADLTRRRDPRFSADLGAFYGLLVGFGQLATIVGSGRVTPRSLVEDVNGWWFSFFSSYASGPPARRLEQLLALARAGVVRFIGAGMWVDADGDARVFRAGGTSTDEVVEGRGLIEARLPVSNVSRTRSPLLRSLRDRSELVEQVLTDPLDGVVVTTGKVTVTDELRIVDGAGRAHPRRFALGIHTSRPAAGTFARPRTNALPFRQNDAVARRVLLLLADLARTAHDDVAMVG